MKAFPKDVEVQTMTERHIGVENELSISDPQTNAIRAEISKRGLLQSIGYDGGGREFRTNPIRVKSLKQVRGLRYTVEYYETLKRNTTVISRGGTHVHISILNSDHENMESNATALAIAFFVQFQKIAGRESTWAYRLDYRTLDAVRAYLNGNKSGRHPRRYFRTGAMLSPTGYQTLEFRGPKGSNDATEVLAWIEFLDNVVRACNRESIQGLTFKSLLRTKRIKAYVESLTGWRKLTDEELNMKFDGGHLY